MSTSHVPLLVKSLQDPKQAMQVGRELLQNLTQQQWDRFQLKNTSIHHLISERTNFVDQLLRRIWKFHLGSFQNLCLVAVGGYGRGELHPFSDIDILILTTEPDTPAEQAQAIEHFITYLWDVGLQVGHAIRTLTDCHEIGKEDISTATNYIESRWLIGNYDAYNQLKELLKQPDFWPSAAFFLAKENEQQARHSKAQDAIAQLEPNIKESPGGLRDIHTLAWVAKRHFGANSLQQLVSVGFMSVEEYNQLEFAMRFHWRVRFVLHSHKQRKEERLLFDHQKFVADILGYQDIPGKLAVEQFMQDYYRNARTIQRLNALLMQHFREALIDTQDSLPEKLSDHILLHHQHISLSNEQALVDNPLLLIELFYWQAQTSAKGMDSKTLRSVQRYAHLINEDFCQQATTWQTFRRLLQCPLNVSQALNAMQRQGLLGRLVPAFHRITGLMQFDLFHAYTVDEHTLIVIRNLRRFMHASAQTKQTYPLACELAQQLSAPDILLLAGLFHDIAKGRGGQHEILGAEDALQFAKQANLTEAEGELLAWLVAKHLIMSHTAQKQDITDPDVIAYFAEQVGTVERLTCLYLLTVADICATSPVVWNGWKDNLLQSLYQRTRAWLTNTPRIEQQAWQQLEHLSDEQKIKVQPIWQNLSHTYYLQQEPVQLQQQARFLANITSLPHIQLLNATINDMVNLLIYTQHKSDVWLKTTVICDAMGLNIVDAHLYTTDDQHSLMSLHLMQTKHSDQAQYDYWLTQLRDCLLDNACPIAPQSHPLVASRQRSFQVNTRVNLLPTTKAHSCELHLITRDQPGLLLRCAQYFHKQQLALTAAKISTAGVRAEDVFYLTQLSHTAEEADWQAIANGLLDHLTAV